MPEICRFYGMVIYMYAVDHNPPHFHIHYGEYEAIMTLDGKIIAGKIPNRATNLVLQWVAQHREELMKNWEKATKMESLDSIEPLE